MAQSKPSETVGFEGLAQTIRKGTLAYAPVMLPARVTAWKAPGDVPAPGGGTARLGPRVDVEITLAYVREISTEANLQPGETLRRSGDRLEAVVPYPPVPDVPYVCPGPRAFRIRKKPEVGETGALVISTRNIKRWRDGAGDGEDPFVGIGALDLASAVFFPGVEIGSETHEWDDDAHLGPPQAPGALADLRLSEAGEWDLDGVTIRITGTGEVVIDGTQVKLGAAAGQALALLPELKAPIATLAGVYAGLPGLVYAVDILAIKAGWAAFAAAIAALPGSLKGRG